VDLNKIEEAIRKGDKPTHDQQPLSVYRTISDTWPRQPPLGQLHVYITLPANMGAGEYFMRLVTPAQDI